MAKANLFYNARDRRWEVRGRSGTTLATWTDDGYNTDELGRIIRGVGTVVVGNVGTLRFGDLLGTTGAIRDLTVNNSFRQLVGGMRLGSLSGTLTHLYRIDGTLPTVTTIGTGAIIVATLGGVASLGIAADDVVQLVAVASMGDGHVGIAGWRVPTTNLINVLLQNSKADSAGSFPITSVKGFGIRFS